MTKILIADDAKLVRSRMVARLGALPGVRSIIETADAKRTLAAIAAEQPDFIVLELHLPDGSGLDILQRLRSTGSLAKVIIHTAWPDDKWRQSSLDAGAEGYFEKGSGSLDAVAAVAALMRLGLCSGSGAGGAATAGTLLAVAGPGAPGPSSHDPDGAVLADGLTVLVVEDHDFQRKTLARLLKRLNATEVLEARDGREAMELLTRHAGSVQLIVCDLDMPRMDGLELLRHVAHSGSRAAVLITSAQELAVLNSVETMCQAYGVRPLGVIEKPVTRDVLAALLQQLKAQASDPAPLSPASPSSALAPAFDLDAILHGLGQGQFEAYFQPKCELATGRIVGAEALARWRHPAHGVLAPMHFIDLLEASGHLDLLTFPMIEASARACHRWHALGLRLGVSVNLSLSSLGDTTLAGRVTSTVRDAGLDPRHMTLEITETAAMTQIAPALENLARLRMHGFGLSIDDFGTGFASMEQLSRIAFTEMKIDRRFVSTMSSRREAGVIVASSIDIGRRLGITTIAEGVETQAQWDALKALDCAQAQGYLISRPIDGERFIDLCQRRNN